MSEAAIAVVVLIAVGVMGLALPHRFNPFRLRGWLDRGAAVGCSTKSIQRFLAFTGGLKRRVKERSALRLSLADREELSRGLVAGDSLRTIATRLGRAPSTISREVAWSGPAAIAHGGLTVRR